MREFMRIPVAASARSARARRRGAIPLRSPAGRRVRSTVSGSAASRPRARRVSACSRGARVVGPAEERRRANREAVRAARRPAVRRRPRAVRGGGRHARSANAAATAWRAGRRPSRRARAARRSGRDRRARSLRGCRRFEELADRTQHDKPGRSTCASDRVAPVSANASSTISVPRASWRANRAGARPTRTRRSDYSDSRR